MTGWMIAVDGSAVNLAHVTHVLAERRASHVDDTWYVLARPAGVALATGLKTREDAVAWIEKRFRSFDQHIESALDHLDKPAGLKVDGTYAYDPQSR